MGLDTTHDCWHGPYSSFMQFRRVIAKAVGITFGPHGGFASDSAIGHIRWGNAHLTRSTPAEPLRLRRLHRGRGSGVPLAERLGRSGRRCRLPGLARLLPRSCGHVCKGPASGVGCQRTRRVSLTDSLTRVGSRWRIRCFVAQTGTGLTTGRNPPPCTSKESTMLTQEQIAARRHSLGSSDAGPMLRISPWKSPPQLWLEDQPSSTADLGDNLAVMLGNGMERVILDAAMESCDWTARCMAVRSKTRPPVHCGDPRLPRDGQRLCRGPAPTNTPKAPNAEAGRGGSIRCPTSTP